MWQISVHATPAEANERTLVTALRALNDDQRVVGAACRLGDGSLEARFGLTVATRKEALELTHLLLDGVLQPASIEAEFVGTAR